MWYTFHIVVGYTKKSDDGSIFADEYIYLACIGAEISEQDVELRAEALVEKCCIKTMDTQSSLLTESCKDDLSLVGSGIRKIDKATEELFSSIQKEDAFCVGVYNYRFLSKSDFQIFLWAGRSTTEIKVNIF